MRVFASGRWVGSTGLLYPTSSHAGLVAAPCIISRSAKLGDPRHRIIISGCPAVQA